MFLGTYHLSKHFNAFKEFNNKISLEKIAIKKSRDVDPGAITIRVLRQLESAAVGRSTTKPLLQMDTTKFN